MTRRLVGMLACLGLAVASCDSGGVIPRDVGATDADAPDATSSVDSEVMADPGALEVPDAAGGGDDAATDLLAPDLGPEVGVTPQPYIPAKSFRLEPAGREGDALVIHVVARDFDALFGVALRVEWDPEVLALADVGQERVFGDQGTAAIYRAGEVRPGSLALVWAFLGSKKEAPLTGDVRLATLKLRVLKAASSPIAFFEPRCLVLTRRLDKVEAVYLSAIVSP